MINDLYSSHDIVNVIKSRTLSWTRRCRPLTLIRNPHRFPFFWLLYGAPSNSDYGRTSEVCELRCSDFDHSWSLILMRLFRPSVTVFAESRLGIGFPGLPTTAKITHSSVKLWFLLNDVYYFCILRNETVLRSFKGYYASRNFCFIINKYILWVWCYCAFLLSEFRQFLESCRTSTTTADSDVRDPAIHYFLCPN